MDYLENRGEFPSRCNVVSRRGGGNENRGDGFRPKFQGSQRVLMGDSNRRILSERNENMYVSNTQDSYLKMGRSNEFGDSFSGHSCSAVAEYNGCIIQDHENTPYDPLSNKLLPRPKYLRFNPNRCTEIFSRMEKDFEEELSSKMASTVEVADVNVSPIEKTHGLPSFLLSCSLVEPSNDEFMEGDDDEEEVDCLDEDEELNSARGGGSYVKGMMKPIFTFIACVVLTSYICSLHSPASSGPQDANWELENGDLMSKNLTLEVDVFNVNMRCSEVSIGAEALANVYSHGMFGSDVIQETRDHIEHVMAEDNEMQPENAEMETSSQLIDTSSEETESADSTFEGSADESNLIVPAEEIIEEVSAMELEIADMDVLSQLAEAYPEDTEFQTSADPTSERSACADESNPVVQAEEILDEVSDLEPEISEIDTFAPPVDAHPEERGSFHLLQHADYTREESTDTMNLVAPLDEIPVAACDEAGKSKKVGWDRSDGVGIYAAVATLLSALALIYQTYHAKSKLIQPQKPLQKMPEAGDREAPEELHNLEKKVEFFSKPPVPHLIEELKMPTLNLNHHVPSVELISEISISLEGRSGNSSNKSINTLFKGDDDTSYQYTTPPPQKRSSIPKKVCKKIGDAAAPISVTPVRRSGRLRGLAAAAAS